MSVKLGPLHSVLGTVGSGAAHEHTRQRAPATAGGSNVPMNTHTYAARIVIVCLPAHDSPAASATGPRSRATAGSTQSM